MFVVSALLEGVLEICWLGTGMWLCQFDFRVDYEMTPLVLPAPHNHQTDPYLHKQSLTCLSTWQLCCDIPYEGKGQVRFLRFALMLYTSIVFWHLPPTPKELCSVI